MKISEFLNILAAIIILTIVAGFALVLKSNWTALAQTFFFSVIIIFVVIFAKKAMAYTLDADVEHSIWKVYQWGWKQHEHFQKELPAGLIFPLFFTLVSLGALKFPALLSYETRALKRRAAKRFGFFSFTEMTEWHNALIGAAGILAALLIAVVTYFLPFSGMEYLAKIAIFYAFANLIPLPNLDGTQIFFGSRVLYTVLAVITIIFMVYAFII